MRLINADEIVTMCENVIQYGIADEDGDHVITAETMLFEVNHLPTVDTVTVRHGRWEKCIGKGLSCKCSVCASKYDIPWRYCPNCGTRMDWKDSDNEKTD